jgi:hypothetical protein
MTTVLSAPCRGARLAPSLLVTVNSPDDQFPPATYSLEIEKPSGTVAAPLPLLPERRYDIIVSASDKDGVLTGAVRRGLAPG